MRYFIYCRKSSEAEDRQVLSIESQLSTLNRTFGGKPEIAIVGVYEEAFSAKAPGRPLFDEMIARLEKREADGIIAWAPDRLARNSIDGGRLVYLLDRGVLTDLKFSTYTFENNSQGKFMLQIMFGQSKYYSDALSENVKRGNRTKIEKGWRPNQAPLGYLNDPITRTIVKDPERFSLIRRMYDLVLTQSYSVRRICDMARDEWGFRTPKRKRSGGKPLALSSVYRILTNPFYAGLLEWNGKLYSGAHEPLVSMEEFHRVAALLSRPDKPKPKARGFPFTGMIRCGECGLLVTAETKINRYGSSYTYYHCSKRRLDYRCRQRSIRHHELERQIEAFIRSLVVPSRFHEWAVAQLKTSAIEDADTKRHQRNSLQVALEGAERSAATLTTLRIRDVIDDVEFTNRRKELDSERIRLKQSIERLDTTADTFEPLTALISFSSRAINWFRDGDDDAKRSILKSVGSNLQLTNGILSIKATKPFRSVAQTMHRPRLRASLEDIRTLIIARDAETLEILCHIQQLEIKFGIRSPGEALRLRP